MALISFWRRKNYEDMSKKDVTKLKRVNQRKFAIVSTVFTVVICTLIVVKFSHLHANRSAVETMAQKMKDRNVKIAVIHRGSENCCSCEVKQEGESMGITVNTFVANYDLANFRNLLIRTGKENFDGVIIHGGNREVVEEIKKLVSKGIPIVAFDSTSELSKIKGITMTSEDDNQIMEYALANMLKQLNSKGNIAYLYAKKHPSLITRHKVYEQFLVKNSGMNEVERFEIGQTEIFMKAKHAVAEMLKRHGRGKIDAIFSIYGEMARGASQAIEEARRNDIKVYTVGFTDADLHMMREEGSPYVSAAGVDLEEIGSLNVKLLLKKIAGEETPSEYKFKPLLVTQEQIRQIEGGINENSLKKVIRGWRDNDDFEEDWMKRLRNFRNLR